MGERVVLKQVDGFWSVLDERCGRYAPFDSLLGAYEFGCECWLLGRFPKDRIWLELPEEEEAMSELDLEKPCEAFVNGKWVPVVGVPVHDRGTLSPYYGCFIEGDSGMLLFKWKKREDIRNIGGRHYEPHTMATLATLTNEWVQSGKNDRRFRITGICDDEVLVGQTWLTYAELAQWFTWSTGPHAGEPVAREVT